MRQIYACSSNPGKLREFDLISGVRLLPLPGLRDIAPPEETGLTFEENAEEKARYYSGFTQEMVLADDSGIEVSALHGAPGIHSARYAGLNADSEANNRLLLQNMLGEADRRARFVCTVALAQQGKVIHTVRGTVEGLLLKARQGAGGFGYDPLFFYPPFGCSFGELDELRKFSVSHRGNALRAIAAWLLANEKA